MTQHLPMVRSGPYFSTPLVHTISCTCGQYTSGKFVSLHDAKRAHREHARSKGDQP